MTNPSFFLGRPIYSLQTMLRQISDEDPRILPVIPDGTYGRNTYASVLSFQRAHHLPATGVTDLTTWEAIVQRHNQVLLTRQTPAILPNWSHGLSILPGQSNVHLLLVQAMLAAISMTFPELTAPTVTGTLDSTTAAGLRWVQKAGSLPQTGALDAKTWTLLNGLYRAAVGNGQAIEK